MNVEDAEITLAQPGLIGDERRKHRRYELQLRLRYKVRNGARVLEMGSGVTRNLSSGGIAFTPDQLLPRGAMVELRIEWPVLLDGKHSLQLTTTGQIVRSSETSTAVRTFSRDFHTATHYKFSGAVGAVPHGLCSWPTEP